MPITNRRPDLRTRCDAAGETAKSGDSFGTFIGLAFLPLAGLLGEFRSMPPSAPRDGAIARPRPPTCRQSSVRTRRIPPNHKAGQRLGLHPDIGEGHRRERDRSSWSPIPFGQKPDRVVVALGVITLDISASFKVHSSLIRGNARLMPKPAIYYQGPFRRTTKRHSKESCDCGGAQNCTQRKSV